MDTVRAFFTKLGNFIFDFQNRAGEACPPPLLSCAPYGTSFHLWWKENLVKHRKFAKYYETDCSFQQFLLKKMLVFSHKMVFTKNEAALPCATMRERARAFAATIYCITFWYSFFIKKFNFCGAFFKRILAWERGIFKR